jgi:hypothetical protein
MIERLDFIEDFKGKHHGNPRNSELAAVDFGYILIAGVVMIAAQGIL